MQDRTKNPGTEQGASILRRTLGVVRKVLQFLAMALLMGWIAGAAVRWDAQLAEAPGFFRGMLHGAIMPMAWPTLLAGQEQEIYSANNCHYSKTEKRCISCLCHSPKPNPCDDRKAPRAPALP